MRNTPVSGMAYVVVGSPDFDAWKKFGAEVLGAMPVARESGELVFRLDQHMARIIVEPGANALKAIGWEVAGRREWEDLHSRLDKNKLKYEEHVPAAGSRRYASRILSLKDPSGIALEFALAPYADPIDYFISPTGANFVTGDQGMGHVTLALADYAKSLWFYCDVLGFHVRETIENPFIKATFAGCNPRHHAIALIDGAGTNSVHHIMVEVDSMDAVGRSLDRVRASKGATRMTVSIGRHWNDLMTSYYVETPSGFQMEYGYGGRRVDPDTWTEIRQGGRGGASLWGHHPVDPAELGFVRAEH